MSTRRPAGMRTAPVSACIGSATRAVCGPPQLDVNSMRLLVRSSARLWLAADPRTVAKFCRGARGEPNEIDQGLIRTQQLRHPRKGLRAVGDDHDLGRS